MFNKRLYLLFVSSLVLLCSLHIACLLIGGLDELIWLGVLLATLSMIYVSQMLWTAIRLASMNMLQVEEVRMLGIQDRLSTKGKSKGEMKYFYTR